MHPNEKGTSTKAEATLRLLNRLVGSWTTEATHPAMPGIVVRGSVVAEWLEGERFLIQRARLDHPDFPDSLSVVGFASQDRVGDGGSSAEGDGQLTMHYFDSRGVFRVFDVEIDDRSLRWHRDSPGFSQRFTGTFADGDGTLIGRAELCRDDVHWEEDLKITYRRVR